MLFLYLPSFVVLHATWESKLISPARCHNFRGHLSNHCPPPHPPPPLDHVDIYSLVRKWATQFKEGWTRTFLFFRTIHPKAKSRLSMFNRPHQHHPNLVSILNTTCGVVSFVPSRLSHNAHVLLTCNPCFALVGHTMDRYRHLNKEIIVLMV